MKIARFLIAEQLLVDSLHLPPGTRIISIKENRSRGYNDYEIIVTNDELRDIEGYEAIPEVHPALITEYAACGHIIDIKLKSWGYRG